MKFYSLIVLTTLALPTASLAQHSDVLLANVNEQVAIGAAVDPGGPAEEFNLSTSVFETILVPGFSPVTPAAYEAEEPGFFALNSISNAEDLSSLGATALPGNAAVSVRPIDFQLQGASGSLFYWDGTGGVAFAPAAVGTSFGFDPTINFAVTGSNGDMDDHPIYELNATSGAPADGVYLISAVVEVDGLTDSESFYSILLADSLIRGEEDAELVEEALERLEEGLATDAFVTFGSGASKDFAFFEEAVEFVENELLIPEPSTALMSLTALGFVSLGSRRRAK